MCTYDMQYVTTQPCPGATPVPVPMPVSATCPAGNTFLLQDYAKSNLCLHVLGSLQGGAWAFPAANSRYVITATCASNTNPSAFPNQGWTWSAPTMTHTASGLVLTVQAPSAAATVNGAGITVSPSSGAINQQWQWNSVGTFIPLMAPSFAMTDSNSVNNSPRGLPVHLWQLGSRSLSSQPVGQPNAAWATMCVPNA
jgi:hypothetical protein